MVTIFALIAGVRPMLTWLEVPLIIGLLVVLARESRCSSQRASSTSGTSQPIWEVRQPGHLLRVADHHSDRETVQQHLSPTLLHIYMLNPLAVIFQQFRHAFITHATPSASALLGSMAALLVPVAIVAIVFVVGFYVFNRIAPRVAEDL